ncbi:hypothetical protein ElyMa_004566600 [Elysia marginata]|uniref:Uncharacterized protein n=1 Tax=Elysia marginata TaxID=1093978 RepID=A0AAV4HW08_9GAST|nr:hypothetical protein ElyMa_004566600 [Elysia marginata]
MFSFHIPFTIVTTTTTLINITTTTINITTTTTTINITTTTTTINITTTTTTINITTTTTVINITTTTSTNTTINTNNNNNNGKRHHASRGVLVSQQCGDNSRQPAFPARLPWPISAHADNTESHSGMFGRVRVRSVQRLRRYRHVLSCACSRYAAPFLEF